MSDLSDDYIGPHGMPGFPYDNDRKKKINFIDWSSAL